MTSLKLTSTSIEADWFAVLVGALLIFALAWLLKDRFASKGASADLWDMPVVGSGSADDSPRIKVPALPRSPTLVSDR